MRKLQRSVRMLIHKNDGDDKVDVNGLIAYYY